MAGSSHLKRQLAWWRLAIPVIGGGISRMPPWVAIQRNPSSGAGRQSQAILDLIRALRVRGLQPQLFSRREALDEAVADPARRTSLVALVAAGGDGTLSDLLRRHPTLPVCPFPLGTENLVAKWLGISRSGSQAAEVIARGQRMNVTWATVHARPFLIMASIGLDAGIVQEVHARRRGGHVRHWNYLAPTLRALVNYQPPTLRVHVDGAESPVTGNLVVVANLSAYALQLPVVPTATGTDGQLHARVFRIPRRRDFLRVMWAVVRGHHDELESVTILTGQQFRIESDQPVAIQADGDPAGLTPAEIILASTTVTLLRGSA